MQNVIWHSVFLRGALVRRHILSYQTNPSLELLPTDSPFWSHNDRLSPRPKCWKEKIWLPAVTSVLQRFHTVLNKSGLWSWKWKSAIFGVVFVNARATEVWLHVVWGSVRFIRTILIKENVHIHRDVSTCGSKYSHWHRTEKPSDTE